MFISRRGEERGHQIHGAAHEHRPVQAAHGLEHSGGIGRDHSPLAEGGRDFGRQQGPRHARQRRCAKLVGE